MESQHSRNRVDDGWPWSCARCGTTVYHDALVCRECDRTESRAAEPPSRGFVASCAAWMRRQSYPEFVTRVGTIAGTELLLTTFWLRLLYSGAVPLPV